MKKVLVSDFDGTFYINDEDIKDNINAVKKFRDSGNIFIIATGRSFMDFKNKLNLYPVKYDYLIINHGATIVDRDDNVISNYAICNNIKNDLVKYLDLKNQKDMFACSKLESRTKIENTDISKIHKKFDTLNKANEINNKINEKFEKYIKSYLIPSTKAIEIISSATDKSKAIREIAELEIVSKENIYTIGDSYNDIEMIREFNGNCMKVAVKELKDISNSIYDSVSNLIMEIMGE